MGNFHSKPSIDTTRTKIREKTCELILLLDDTTAKYRYPQERRHTTHIKMKASSATAKQYNGLSIFRFSVILFIFFWWQVDIVESRHRYVDDATNPLGCSATPSLRVVKYLDRICNDCYMIYRDPDLYPLCRSNCYKNSYFLTCMDVMMVSKMTRHKAAGFVNMINTFTTRRWNMKKEEKIILVQNMNFKKVIFMFKQSWTCLYVTLGKRSSLILLSHSRNTWYIN